MGFLNSIESMLANRGAGGNENPQASVAGGLMSALEEHPGGLGGLMQHMQNNGVDAQQVAQGQASSPDQMEQGLAGSGIIEKISERTGMSPEMVKVGLATVLPVVMAHFTQGGTQAPPQSGFGGMAGQILGKFL